MARPFGDGRINVYSSQGEFIDRLESATGRPITIAKLWTLSFGGGLNSSPGTL